VWVKNSLVFDSLECGENFFFMTAQTYGNCWPDSVVEKSTAATAVYLSLPVTT